MTRRKLSGFDRLHNKIKSNAIYLHERTQEWKIDSSTNYKRWKDVANDWQPKKLFLTAKDLEDGEADEATGRAAPGLKTQYINQYKQTANSMLASTDWMVVRKIERNIDIPAETATKRAAIVAEADRLETAIAAVTTVEQLIAVVESANFVG